MRVALLSANAQAHNAIGNQVAEKAAFFHERGAQVRVFLQDTDRLHADLRAFAEPAGNVAARGPVWEYLFQAELVIADYAQYHELLHFLPLLVGHKPRLVFDYHGVTPACYWEGPQRDLAERSANSRGFVWCADVALAHSRFGKAELQRATGYPAERILVLPYPTDTTLFQSTGARHQTGSDHGPAMLYVGRLAASKRVSLLIEALPLIPNAQAMIVGDTSDVYGAEADRCREIADRLGVADRVRFLGQLDESALAHAYGAADVLVMSSLHEGYCLPAIEAMASGLPVVAARTTALPETLGDAGLTFDPDDAEDLARQVRRILGTHNGWRALSWDAKGVGPRSTPVEDSGRATLSRVRRVAIVAFRFGADIIGGAESSLRTIAQAFQRGGIDVEIFTTCTSHESAWTNDLPAGTFAVDGLTVHRFPIDAHDRVAHHNTLRRIIAADGRVDVATAGEYLRHSIHSSKLIQALAARRSEFDAIVTGPYLFGLTHDVATAFPDQTLLVPCFHDEPYVRLGCWQQSYGAVGGILYHSPEEREFAECVLGLNHPRTTEIGALIDARSTPSALAHGLTEPYVVYCGRYSEQKNLPLLLEYAERYQREQPGRFRFVFVGHGEVRIPEAAWAVGRGRLEEEEKRQVLAHAAALVQLSRQESLSLVVLEAWAQGIPVIVHQDCAVLRGQTERARGGRAVESYNAFAAALDDLWQRPDAWRALGANGRAYVIDRYGSEDAYRRRLLDAIDSLTIPLRDCLRQRGLARAAERDRPRWRERFGQFVERVLDEGPRLTNWDVAIQPQTTMCRAVTGSRTALVSVRVINSGTLPALPDGPAPAELVGEVIDMASGELVGAPCRTDLPRLLSPGASIPAALGVNVPREPGQYQLLLYVQRAHAPRQATGQTVLPLFVGVKAPSSAAPDAGAFLETIQAALAEIHRLQRLPDDYNDVTAGRFARWKRWLKQKLLGNFKKGYVDVLSRQQTQVNQHLLLCVQQLGDYCATLEHAVHGLQQRLGAATPTEMDPALLQLRLRDLQRSQQSHGLVHRLLALRRRDTVGNDAGAGLQVDGSSDNHHGP